MLSVLEIIENLPAHIVYPSKNIHEIEISKVLAGDLMSDFLVSTDSVNLLITGLATEQTVRTADILGAQIILLVNDKLPSDNMKRIAEETDITVLATPLPLYEACIAIDRLLEIESL